MIVYRLEDENGYGVWSGGNYFGLLDYDDDTAIWTKGCADNLRGRNWSANRFGAESESKLATYFGRSYKKLLSHGFTVAKYKVRKNYVTFGSNGAEVIFPIDKAERLSPPIEDKREQIETPFGRVPVRPVPQIKQVWLEEYSMLPDDVSPFGESVVTLAKGAY